MYTLHYAPDNASLIVRLALEHVGAPYRTALVDRGTQAQRSPAYLALNPNGQIPTLETPQGPIFETGAILLWLAERHPGLMPPPEAPERGAALTWLVYTANTLHAQLRMLFYTSLYTAGDPAPVVAQVQANLARSLATLEAHLPHAPCFAQKAYLAPCLRWCALYGPAPKGWFRLAAFPRLSALASEMDESRATLAAIRAEGLGPTPFTAPQPPQPPEGSAL
jgi:glutathione S-transferase